MKCPKCHYVSHDYLDACRKCGVDLVSFKQDLGLLVLQPGGLDLSLVLGGAGADDLFGSVDEEGTMHASDDDAEHPGIRRAPAGAPRPGGWETEEKPAGMDHLTLELDVSHIDFGPMTPSSNTPEMAGMDHLTLELDTSDLPTPSSNTPEAESLDEAVAESADDAVSMADSSGAVASLLQDVVLADETPAAPEEPEPELVEVETTFARIIDAERRAASEEAEEATSTVANSVALSLDDSALAMEADEPSGSDVADVVEPALTTLDAPPPEDMGLLPSFEFDLDTLKFDLDMLVEAETTLSDPAVPTPDEAPLAELTLEDALTSSDLLALEDLEASTPPGHLTLELNVPTLSVDLEASLLEDAARMPPPDDLETTETSPGAGADPGFPAADAVVLEDLDDLAIPGHLTLELDASEMMSDVSPIILDHLQLEDLPDDVKSKMSPPDDQGDDEEELLLDLDDLTFDDDEPV